MDTADAPSWTMPVSRPSFGARPRIAPVRHQLAPTAMSAGTPKAIPASLADARTGMTAKIGNTGNMLI